MNDVQKTRCSEFIIWFLLFFLGLCHWGHTQISILKDQTFQTAEDISLSSDIYLPDTNTALPVILLRTPYGKQQYKDFGQFFAQQSYVVVIQDVRGKFASSGTFLPFYHEKPDGLATLDWIAKQQWCNGDIGMFGVSYPAFCALSLADQQHPNLRTIVNISGWVRPEDMAADGGAFHLLLNLPWLLHEETLTKRDINDYDLDSLFWHLPLKDAMQSVDIKSAAWEDQDLLKTVNHDFNYDQVNLPILHLCGAFDFVKKGTLAAYTALKKRNKANQQLIFGPWFHNQYLTSLTEVGILECGPAAKMGYPLLLEKAKVWFDQYLKTDASRADTNYTPEVFFMLENKWKPIPGFPFEEACEQSWYLSSSSGANSRFGDGTLNLDKTTLNGIDSFLFNPHNPVYTNGGANFHFFPHQLGVKDQSELEERTDVLVYTSPAFAKKTSIAGNVQLQLFAATDGLDTDFSAKLVLVDLDGVAMNMLDGIVRGRYRNGTAKEALLRPHEVYEYTIDLGTTAFSIPPDYRLRIEVSSSNFPKYDRNANTSMHPFEATHLRNARQKIYFGEQYPTRLILPIICQ